jgi:TRAP-type C4-dicarboxylate transport system permease small subunit
MGIESSRWLARFEKAIALISRILNNIGISFLMLLMLLITADVFLRAFFRRPILGTNELSEFIMIIVVYLAIAYTQHTKSHVSVDLVISRFPQRAQDFVDSFIYLLSLAICSLITWRAFADIDRLMDIHRVSDVLNVPVVPFQTVMAVGFFLFSLVLLLDFIHTLRKAIKK